MSLCGTHETFPCSVKTEVVFSTDEQQGSVSQQLKAPVVRVDPERRCAVMLIYGSHLVILPFRQEGLLDDHDPDSVFTSRSVLEQ